MVCKRSVDGIRECESALKSVVCANERGLCKRVWLVVKTVVCIKERK